MPDKRKLRRGASAFAIRRANGKNQIPLPEQRSIGGEERVTRVINARGFGGRTVEFDDLEVSSGSQILLVRIADVVAANVEACQLSRDGVHPFGQRHQFAFRQKTKSIALKRVKTSFKQF